MARPRKNGPGNRPPLKSEDVAEIPVEEQPYPLPKGWKWVRLGDITQIIGGGTPPSKVKEYYENGDIPWLSPADLSGYREMYISHGKKMLTAEGIKNSSARMMPAETVCLSSRAPIGYVAIAKNPLCTNQGFKSFLPSHLYIPKFLYWYLKGSKPLLESYASGTTFLELSGSKAARIEFPLPPLDEQRRIVHHIESLFAKLDEAKEQAEAVLDGFETRKAAILHKAFSGELTEKWRANQKTYLSRWENKNFSELVESSRLGLIRSKAEQSDSYSYKYLKMNNISFDGKLLLEDMVTVEASLVERDLFELKYGDFLFNTRNSFELVGKSSVFTSCERNILYNNNIMQIKFIKGINPFYVNYFFHSPKGRFQLNKLKKNTTNVAAIYAKDLNLMSIPVAPSVEQQEIVRVLDTLLSKEQQTKDAAETVLEEIELMKKSILARAFRGELR